jgi:hypothetical protein
MDIEKVKALIYAHWATAEELNQAIAEAKELRESTEKLYYAIVNLKEPKEVQERWDNVMEAFNKMLEKREVR